MELLSLGALDTILRSQGPSLANHTRLAICEQLVSAMCELVAEGLTHGDLAVRNVLVKSMTPVHVKVGQTLWRGFNNGREHISAGHFAPIFSAEDWSGVGGSIFFFQVQTFGRAVEILFFPTPGWCAS